MTLECVCLQSAARKHVRASAELFTLGSGKRFFQLRKTWNWWSSQMRNKCSLCNTVCLAAKSQKDKYIQYYHNPWISEQISGREHLQYQALNGAKCVCTLTRMLIYDVSTYSSLNKSLMKTIIVLLSCPIGGPAVRPLGSDRSCWMLEKLCWLLQPSSSAGRL